MLGSVEQYIIRKIKKENCIHFSLIDPENIQLDDAVSITKSLEKYGTSAIMIGGSTIASTSLVDEIVKVIKNSVKIPVILFPNNLSGVSRYADAIWFMSLLNSNNPLFISGFQSLAAPMIKRYEIETISLAYIIIGEGSTAAYIGQAHAIPHDAFKIAMSYALAAEYLGMHFIYLEAGSGARKPISPEMVTLVKNNVSIPVIVGGGIRESVTAKALAIAGADGIVTGTIVESDESCEKVREIIKSIKHVSNSRALGYLL